MEDLKFKTAATMMKRSNKEGDSDFFTNRNKRFAMAINGYRISVQWGTGNYTDDPDVRYSSENEMDYAIWGCDTAEVLIWDEQGRFVSEGATLFDVIWDGDDQLNIQGGHSDQVFACCSSDCVAKMIGTLSSCGNEDPRRSIAQIYNASFSK